MTVLSIVQSVCARIGLPKPSTAATATDTQVLQIVELANEEGKELSKRPTYGWVQLQTSATFTTVAAETQGAIATIAPGLDYIVNDTIWNRDLRRPIFGPLTPQRWQQLKAMNVTGPWNQFRIQGANLLFIPAPAAGQHCYFEYSSKNWVSAAGGASTKSAFTQDDDYSLLDEELITLGTIWRWKAAKGLAYSEDYNKYERQVMDAIARNGSKDVINMSGVRYDLMPGITIPSGNWSL